MRTGEILIRADASAAIGTGHAMRCLALAQAWQDAGGKADFVMAESTPAIRTRIQAEGCEATTTGSDPGTADDLQQTITFARQRNCEWIAVDGYHFGADYQAGLKAAGFKVLLLDDYGHSDHYSADVVLNQNVSAVPDIYAKKEENTRLLLGPTYALLRREFKPWIGWQRTIAPVCSRVLVTMGGSDESNFTEVAIKALHLADRGELEVLVLVGGSNPNFQKLQDMAANAGPRIKLLKDVSNMGELMATADVAISAAGTTFWELCLLGLPALLIDVADNQTALAKELHKRGCAIHVGDRNVTSENIAKKFKGLAADERCRSRLSHSSRQLVDGRGAMRVVSLLRGPRVLRLRPVRIEDRRLLWEWANDVQVRAASFSSGPIPWEDHLAWFDEKLRESQSRAGNCRIFIAEDEVENAAGEIRFERRLDQGWDVGISLSREFRGLGLAYQVIERGVEALLGEGRNYPIHAYVKEGNVASVKAFERAGFQRIGTVQVRGQRAMHFMYRISSDNSAN